MSRSVYLGSDKGTPCTSRICLIITSILPWVLPHFVHVQEPWLPPVDSHPPSPIMRHMADAKKIDLMSMVFMMDKPHHRTRLVGSKKAAEATMVLDRLHSGVVQSSPEWSRLNTHDILMLAAKGPPVPLDIYGSSTVPYISNGNDFTNAGRHGALSLTSLYSASCSPD